MVKKLNIEPMPLYCVQHSFFEACISTWLVSQSFIKLSPKHSKLPTSISPILKMELNWNSSDESDVIIAQLLDAYPDMNTREQEASLGIDPLFWFDEGASSYNLLDDLSSYWTGTSNTVSSSNFLLPTSEFQFYELGCPNAVSTDSMDYLASEEQMSGSSLMGGANYQAEGLICSNDIENKRSGNVMDIIPEAIAVPGDDSVAKRKFLDPESEIPAENSKKAPPSVRVQKSVNNSRSKKGKKNAATSEEALSNDSFNSEDESTASQELNECSSSNAKGKRRAGRGSATDPQSLYARKRRERINERLRILQNLVPNGTKVDISTMLEEAVQFVKFMQLQIKLLSSDDMWMYAPLAYNGMNLGLDLKLPLPQ